MCRSNKTLTWTGNAVTKYKDNAAALLRTNGVLESPSPTFQTQLHERHPQHEAPARDRERIDMKRIDVTRKDADHNGSCHVPKRDGGLSFLDAFGEAGFKFRYRSAGVLQPQNTGSTPLSGILEVDWPLHRTEEVYEDDTVSRRLILEEKRQHKSELGNTNPDGVL